MTFGLVFIGLAIFAGLAFGKFVDRKLKETNPTKGDRREEAIEGAYQHYLSTMAKSAENIDKMTEMMGDMTKKMMEGISNN